METHLIFLLVIIFQVKHYLCDFPLQSEYMVFNKSLPNWGFFKPLALHCCVHAFFTLIICMVFNPAMWWLAIVDGVSHFCMDRIKSGPKYLGRYSKVDKPSFWNCFGFDQMFHHLTHYFIVWMLLSF